MVYGKGKDGCVGKAIRTKWVLSWVWYFRRIKHKAQNKSPKNPLIKQQTPLTNPYPPITQKYISLIKKQPNKVKKCITQIKRQLNLINLNETVINNEPNSETDSNYWIEIWK